MKTIRIAACRQNINILDINIVNKLPGVFRDVKTFFKKWQSRLFHAGCMASGGGRDTGVGGYAANYQLPAPSFLTSSCRQQVSVVNPMSRTARTEKAIMRIKPDR